MMRKRKRLYDKYKRTNRETDYTAYKLFRNKVKSELKRSKNLVTDKLVNKLSESNLKPKDSWKTLKQFIKPQQKTTIPPLHNDGTIIQDDVDKSNFLNDYLTQQTTLNEANASLPSIPPHSRHSLSSIIITADEVQSTLKSLSIGKVTGPDSISNRLLKELTVPLSPIFSTSRFDLEKSPNCGKKPTSRRSTRKMTLR